MIYLSIKYLKISWKSVVFAEAADRSRDFLPDVPFLTQSCLLNQFPPQSGVCFFVVLRTCASQSREARRAKPWINYWNEHCFPPPHLSTAAHLYPGTGLSDRGVRWLFTPESAPVSDKWGAIVCFGALISTGASARSFSTFTFYFFNHELQIDFNARLKFATLARSMLASPADVNVSDAAEVA